VAAKKPFAGSPGATEVGNWNTQIIPKTATTVSTSGVQDSTGVGTSEYAKKLYAMTAAERKTIAQALKGAGYKVNTNGVYSRALVDAYGSAIMSAQLSAQELGQPFNDTFFTGFIARETAARAGSGDGGPKIVEQLSTITDSDAKLLINAIIRDKDQRAATAAEIEKYTNIIQRKAAKQPTITRTEKVGGKTIIKTTPGFGLQEAKTFLVDKISGTDEAKANKVLGYYETFMNALGAK
jgi:hypothetical protein